MLAFKTINTLLPFMCGSMNIKTLTKGNQFYPKVTKSNIDCLMVLNLKKLYQSICNIDLFSHTLPIID